MFDGRVELCPACAQMSAVPRGRRESGHRTWSDGLRLVHGLAGDAARPPLTARPRRSGEGLTAARQRGVSVE